MSSDCIAVVATVLNEADNVRQWVDSLFEQTRLPDEMVVVDGGSTDGTVDILELMARDRPSLRVLRAPGANIATGRNRAIAATHADVVVVSDAGTVAAADWLQRLVAPIEHGRSDMVGGFFVPAGTGLLERVLATVTRPHLNEVDPQTFLPSSRCVAFRRRVWARVGGYPEWLSHCEDLVFDYAALASGASLCFEPAALVTWSARPSLRLFGRQFYFYARGDGHAGLWTKRHILRYSSYGLAIIGVFWFPRIRNAMALAGTGYLLWRPYRRLFSERERFKPHELAAAMGLVPAIAVVGDVSKMVGYAVGCRQRRKVRPRWFVVGADVCNRQVEQETR